ncbi:DNA-binding transcriptional regulator LysR [compost metagenome]
MEGLGVALINPLVAVNYRHMGLITKPFAPSVKHQGYVIYPKERANERIIVDFISSLKNVLAEQLNALD